MKQPAMIIIDKNKFIGKGYHQACYRHPQNPDLCVKVNFSGDKGIWREIRYYKHLEKRGISWEKIARYHGRISTDMGVGWVFDLVRDQDKSISKPLTHYIQSEEETEKYFDSLASSISSLKEYLFHNRIITMDLDPANILAQRRGGNIYSLYLIDNICNTELIPISTYVQYFARKKIGRKWGRFENHLAKAFNHNRLLTKIIRNI